MINLYRVNETVFNHNQFILNECITCDVTESLDGTFELDLEYPLKDSKSISKELVTGAYIKVPLNDDREPQLFCLRRPKSILSRVNAYGQHIATAKLSKNMIKDINIIGKTRKEALQQILSNTMYPNNFTVGNRDINTTVNNIRIVRYSPLTAIIGDGDNTISNIYGGELIMDNFILDMVDTRGEDTGLIISHKKNLTGAELTTDDLELITEIIPIGNDDLLLPEYSIKSPNFSNYSDAYIKEVKVDIGVVEPSYDSNDVLTNADEVFTAEQCYQYMRQYVNNMFIYEKVDQLNFNLTVNFIQLQDTEEYKTYKGLAKVKQVGDIVTVKHEVLGLNLKGRVQKIKWDAITRRIKEIEVGFNKKSIVDIVKETKKQVGTVTKSVTTVAKTVVDTKEKLTKEIKEAKKSTSDLKVVMEASDSKIELSVSNLKEDTESSIEVMEDKIESKVEKDDFGSLITQHYNEIVQAIIDATGTHKCTFNGSGLTVQNGGFKILNSSNQIVLWLGDDGYVKLKDLQLDNTAFEKGSYFYTALRNMAEIAISDLVIKNKLEIDNDAFEIAIGGNNYNFSNAVKHVMS